MENINKIKRIGVLTSGGDAPGMNAAVRAVTRTALKAGLEVYGIKHGYQGLLNSDFVPMDSKYVSDILGRGGTVLFTSRCEEMRTPEGLAKAAEICRILGLDVLFVIGGNGSFAGALELSKRGVNVMGIPGTIDLDLPCSEYTIGFDTAINTAIDCINRLKDTSCSHERCSVVEVMGRNSGHIALWTALTCGAEDVLLPEEPVDFDSVIKQISFNKNLGKMHNLIIVAEGVGNSQKLADKIQEITGIQTRVTILGHIQRGGAPTACDRYNASIMGYNAVMAALEGKQNRIIIKKDNKFSDIDFEEGLKQTSSPDDAKYKIIKTLAV